MAQPLQLTFDFAHDTRAADFRATRPLLKHRKCRMVLEKLAYVRHFFPELRDRTIRVGLTRVACGMAVPGGSEIWFNPSQISYHAIAHELVHLLQGVHDIPRGERSCDLYALARHWTLNDRPPYYLRVPERFVNKNGTLDAVHARWFFAVATRAIELKRRGLRNYIAYFEKAVAEAEERRGLSVKQPARPASLIFS
jgi:hypothetical protein